MNIQQHIDNHPSITFAQKRLEEALHSQEAAHDQELTTQLIESGETRQYATYEVGNGVVRRLE